MPETPRRSSRANKGHPPQYLNDYVSYQAVRPRSTPTMQSDDDLDDTVVGAGAPDQSGPDQTQMMRQLMAEVAHLREELRQEKQKNASAAADASANAAVIAAANAAARANPVVHIAAPTIDPAVVQQPHPVMLDLRLRQQSVPRSNVGSSYESGSNNDNFAAAGMSNPPSLHRFSSRSSLASNLMHHPRSVVDLPKFDGRPEDWRVFMSAYDSTTTYYGYSDMDNLFRLQKALTGEARDSVQELILEADNVPSILAALEINFGRPDMLVRTQTAKVRALQPVTDSNIGGIVPFASAVRNLVAFLNRPETSHHLSNTVIIDELVAKLPVSMGFCWAEHAESITPYVTLLHLSQWLDKKARSAKALNLEQSSAATPSTGTSSQSRPPRPRRENSKPVVLHTDTGDGKCEFCQMSGHQAAACRLFTKAQRNERWRMVKEKRLCFRCFKRSHVTRDCPSKAACGLNGCDKPHHQLLHNPGPQQQGQTNASTALSTVEVAAPQEPAPCPCAQQGNAVHHVGTNESRPLFRIVPVRLYGPRGEVHTFALLDEGSSITLMDGRLSEELGLTGPKKPLKLRWFGNRTTSEDSTVVDLHISDVAGTKQHRLSNVHTVGNLELPMQTIDVKQLHTRYDPLKHLPVASYTDASPRLLIGLDNGYLGFAKQGIETSRNGPMAARTRLGWVIYGRMNPSEHGQDEAETLLQVSSDADDHLCDIQKIVHDYFTTENFGVALAKPIESAANERAMTMLERLTKRSGNRFETGLLWAADDVHLPDSRPMAMRRFSSVEKKMERDPVYAAAYKRIIADYVTKGYARKLSAAEAAQTTVRTWYLPHFCVSNHNKPGKLRLVFDAAASVAGVSLNSCLLKGPDLNRPMTAVLHQFREGPVGVCGDIREMFHQILIRPEDQQSQRFLWRENVNTPVQTFAMVAMTFGAACSPCAAQFVKNKNADLSKQAADIIAAIKTGHYVDDFVVSFATTEEATRITQGVIDVHRQGGFELRNFVSNDQHVLRAIGGSGGTTSAQILANDAHTDKILGLFWNTQEDAFQFRLQFHHVEPSVLNRSRRPTKRELLSIAMSVFDPFGMLANFTVYAKLQLQELWRVGLDWDSLIPEELNLKWTQWMDELKECGDARVPRCYSPHFNDTDYLELHVFADASAEAFASVAYWRLRSPSGRFDVSFIAGKTKCAPQKMLSIPRLELQAAVMATRLRDAIVGCHARRIDRTVFWTDAKTVIQWIWSDHRRYKPFVAHRIAEILATSEQANWRWVPTDDNVADDATRAPYPPKYDLNGRWLTGPPFLHADEADWPKTPAEWTKNAPDDEVRARFILLAQTGPMSTTVIDFEQFPTYLRLLRITTYMLRFIANLKAKKKGLAQTRGEIREQEQRAAIEWLCRTAQQEGFGDEYAALSTGHLIDQRSHIYKLSPFMDKDRVVRMQGRLNAASHLPFNQRHPILLPRKHTLTKLIVEHHHQKLRHQQQEAVICAVRQDYWVPQIRVLVRAFKAECGYCKLQRATPQPAMMGQLPVDRVTPFVRPFTYTGLDYFGPLHVTIGRRKEKRWVALFTCLTVRAVHLELAGDLTTDACILCIRNFVNTRGVPVRIRSDNGTNFVGASKEIQNAVPLLDCDAIARELTARRIEWHFNCPGNPEAGGAWERMVQCVKRALHAALKETAPQVETLRSVLIEAANIVNSRPLTHVPVDPTDELPLTPNHFLLGGPNATQTPGPDDEKLHTLRQQWRVAQHLKNTFWKRWLDSYLPELTRRHRLRHEHPAGAVAPGPDRGRVSRKRWTGADGGGEDVRRHREASGVQTGGVGHQRR